MNCKFEFVIVQVSKGVRAMMREEKGDQNSKFQRTRRGRESERLRRKQQKLRANWDTRSRRKEAAAAVGGEALIGTSLLPSKTFTTSRNCELLMSLGLYSSLTICFLQTLMITTSCWGHHLSLVCHSIGISVRFWIGFSEFNLSQTLFICSRR